MRGKQETVPEIVLGAGGSNLGKQTASIAQTTPSSPRLGSTWAVVGLPSLPLYPVLKIPPCRTASA